MIDSTAELEKSGCLVATRKHGYALPPNRSIVTPLKQRCDKFCHLLLV
jgi:biotin operon repressor